MSPNSEITRETLKAPREGEELRSSQRALSLVAKSPHAFEVLQALNLVPDLTNMEEPVTKLLASQQPSALAEMLQHAIEKVQVAFAGKKDVQGSLTMQRLEQDVMRTLAA